MAPSILNVNVIALHLAMVLLLTPCVSAFSDGFVYPHSLNGVDQDSETPTSSMLKLGGQYPSDPPFDLTKVLFSGAFTDHVVLHRAPNQASVYGTATPGASVSLIVAGSGYSYTTPAVVVTTDKSDSALHGTWKVVLPARPAGFDYTIVAKCAGCPNTTVAMLEDVSFGDVWLCSGQSNMEVPLLTTFERNVSFAEVSDGKYANIRLFQTGWRLGFNKSTWVLPQHPSSSSGYPMDGWQLPSNDSLTRFSAMCWYFGKEMIDLKNTSANVDDGNPVPLGLIGSFVGGTSIQQWMPSSTTGNNTCERNNCGYSVLPLSPSCANASLSNVWSCPSNHCSDLYHSMIAPFVNMTITGAIWYQGENNVVFGSGSIPEHSGYACQQQHMIKAWREAFSAVVGTTDTTFPFGVTSLAGGCAEGQWSYSPFQHISRETYDFCQIGANRRLQVCMDGLDDYAGGLRAAQTGGYGHLPNPSLPNTFLGQAFDMGDPYDKGCIANTSCLGWNTPYSFNRTWWYEISPIHPRVKQPVAQRLARAASKLMQGKLQAVPKFSGCRLEAASATSVTPTFTIHFDQQLLDGDDICIQMNPKTPGTNPLQVLVGENWTSVVALTKINATSISVQLPTPTTTTTGATQTNTSSNTNTITAVRYAWASYPCCPGIDRVGEPCPPVSCPIMTTSDHEPAVPFYATIVDGKCKCDDPWQCDD